MTTLTTRATDRVALLAAIDPLSRAAGTVNSAWVPVSGYDALLGILKSGALGANATVDAKLQQAKDAAGTGAKDIAAKAITQLTQAGTDKSNKQVLLNARVADLDVANDFTHVRLSVTVAVAASVYDAVLLGIGNRHGAVVQAASVDQVIK